MTMLDAARGKFGRGAERNANARFMLDAFDTATSATTNGPGTTTLRAGSAGNGEADVARPLRDVRLFGDVAHYIEQGADSCTPGAVHSVALDETLTDPGSTPLTGGNWDYVESDGDNLLGRGPNYDGYALFDVTQAPAALGGFQPASITGKFVHIRDGGLWGSGSRLGVWSPSLGHGEKMRPASTRQLTSPAHREVVELTCLEGLSLYRAACRLGVSPRRIRTSNRRRVVVVWGRDAPCGG